MAERNDDGNCVKRNETERKGTRTSRRRVLAFAGAAIAGGAAATGSAAGNESETERDDERTDDPTLGGGQGYGNTVSRDEADVVVGTRSELGTALSNATSGDVVYVAGNAKIDLGDETYTVPSGVTLASNRGIDDAPGGHLHTDAEVKSIEIQRDARVTGLRVQGPYYEYFNPIPDDDWYPDGIGLRTVEDGVEIDNCEVWGFAQASVSANGDAHVHHNHIHHNPRDGLGYGVLGGGGHPVIEWNYFNYNRHGVASTGSHHGYTCRYNHFAPKSTDIVIDIHKPGGVSSEVHNNIVEPLEEIGGDRNPLQAIQVRGVPDETYDVYDNWFFNPTEPRDSPTGSWTDEAIIQVHVQEWTNVEFWNNHYGEDADVSASDIIPGYEI